MLLSLSKTNMASDDEEIPETGAIFTFGKTRFAENLANKFWIRDDRVLQLACGDEHSAVITSSGRLYTFGSNDWGQLGHGNSKPYTKPSVVKKLKGDKVKAVACGRSHTLVISESGVFSFGAGSDSQLGHGDNKGYNIPTEIEALSDKTINHVSCGAEHSAAVTGNGELYVWGSGSEGQLGLGISECELPTLLKFRSKVTLVDCGYYHTAVITELGKLYTFGDNEAGKLGLEDNQCEDTEQPQQVKTLNEPVVSVSCGGNHTAVVTKRGSLFTFGSGMHGQLGHGPVFQEVALPKLVSMLQGKCVADVSCGESHSAVITKNGEMFTFGDGRHGKLGMGDESFSNLFQPAKVTRFKKFNVEQVSCGGCHMLAVAARKTGDIKDSEESEQDINKIEEHSGEDVPDGPRLSQTVPISGMTARDKRRRKDTDGVPLTSSLPPLNRSSLPPLASLGLASTKKDEKQSIKNGKLNPLNRSMLPTISIKSPSPEDEENSVEKLSNSRRLPPRPKRRQKKVEPPSDSEEDDEGEQKASTTPRPTPLPRKQKNTWEKQKNNDDSGNVNKFQKGQKTRENIEKSGSEASDEDSDEGGDSTNRPSSSQIFTRNGEKSEPRTREGVSEEGSEEDEGNQEDGVQEDDKEENKTAKDDSQQDIEKKQDEEDDDDEEETEEETGDETGDEEGEEVEDEAGDEEEDKIGDEGKTKEKTKDEGKDDGKEEKDKKTKDSKKVLPTN
ncbi:X-linked retinitis pigmentosa GTPase regulator-like [Dendronephthya gigantea]|uniref:X-linked retinitis pigmentosa GTPase regulator-like n=1 Tax=Dendronephthya gigantea TaxID=151771 RepID=UPI00106CCD6D|nr:X-linked retinitis pigmentosa GTPase regulator-like [Dendronephthya gigantea]